MTGVGEERKYKITRYARDDSAGGGGEKIQGPSFVGMTAQVGGKEIRFLASLEMPVN